MGKKRKRLYLVGVCSDYEYAEVVCAYSVKEAKQIAWDSSDFIQDVALDGNGWIDVSVSWIKGAYVSGLKIGCIIPNADSLRRDTFHWVEDTECPICFNNNTLRVINSNDKENVFKFVSCSNCEEKYLSKKLNKVDIPRDAILYKYLKKCWWV